MRISALSLGLEEGKFDTAYGHGRAANGMRVAHYVDSGERGNDDFSRPGPRLRYGAHTDYTGFTLLWRNQSNGLQCQNPFADGAQWINIPNREGCIVVNAGDLIEVWTNGYWKSNVHRVLAARSADDFPLSVVFFTGPHSDTWITPLESEKVQASLSSYGRKYEDIHAGDHLRRKLEKSNV